MINFSNFDQLIVEKKATALLVFTADWCRPCLLQKAVIEKLQTAFVDKVLIELIDVDVHEELANKFAARTLPTSVIFGNGEMIEILAGFQTEEFLSSYFEHIISSLQKQAAEDKK